MRLQFYMHGDVVPAVYDFDLTCGGALRPSGFETQYGRGIVMIVLENSGDGLTMAQAVTVNCLCGINRDWEKTFYFEAPVATGD